jgi:hypothetical protein
VISLVHATCSNEAGRYLVRNGGSMASHLPRGSEWMVDWSNQINYDINQSSMVLYKCLSLFDTTVNMNFDLSAVWPVEIDNFTHSL